MWPRLAQVGQQLDVAAAGLLDEIRQYREPPVVQQALVGRQPSADG
jgi:hypothetical protein